jgi:hypothetical protein
MTVAQACYKRHRQADGRRPLPTTPAERHPAAVRIAELHRSMGNAAVARAMLQRVVTVKDPPRTVSQLTQDTADSLEQNFGASREALDVIAGWAKSDKQFGPFDTWWHVVAAAKATQVDEPVFEPSSKEVVLDASDIINHFLKSFKTVLIASIPSVGSLGRFYNDTQTGEHAEDKLMVALYARDVELRRIKQKHFLRDPMVLCVRINNSPCMRCAEGLVEYLSQSPVDKIMLEAANIYTYGGDEAIEYMSGRGITVDWLDIEMALAEGGVDLQTLAHRLGGTIPKRLDARRRRTERTKDVLS